MKFTKSQLKKIIKEESRAARHEKRQAIFQDLDAMSDKERSAWWELAWDQMGSYNAKELWRSYDWHKQQRAEAARTLHNMNSLLDRIADIYKGAYPTEVFGKLETALEDAEKTLNFDEIKNLLKDPGAPHGRCNVSGSPLGKELLKWIRADASGAPGHGNVWEALKNILEWTGQECHGLTAADFQGAQAHGGIGLPQVQRRESKMKVTKSQLIKIIKEELNEYGNYSAAAGADLRAAQLAGGGNPVQSEEEAELTVGGLVGELRVLLEEWQKKEYPSDEARYEGYYNDILQVTERYDPCGHPGESCEESHPDQSHEECILQNEEGEEDNQ